MALPLKTLKKISKIVNKPPKKDKKDTIKKTRDMMVSRSRGGK